MAGGIELLQGIQHGDDVLARHAGTGAAADRENDAFAAGAFEDLEGLGFPASILGSFRGTAQAFQASLADEPGPRRP